MLVLREDFDISSKQTSHLTSHLTAAKNCVISDLVLNPLDKHTFSCTHRGATEGQSPSTDHVNLSIAGFQGHSQRIKQIKPVEFYHPAALPASDQALFHPGIPIVTEIQFWGD